MPAIPTNGRPKLRFSLRWLLVLLTLASIALAWPASIVRQASLERAIVANLKRHRPELNWKTIGPEWLHAIVGVERCQAVQAMTVHGSVPRDLPRLQRLHQLEVLKITECDLGDAHIERVGVLRQVKELTLDQTSITDRALGTIEQYPSLLKLNVGHTQISHLGIKRFKERRPYVALEYGWYPPSQGSLIGQPKLPRVFSGAPGMLLTDLEPPLEPTPLNVARIELPVYERIRQGHDRKRCWLLGPKFNDGHLAALVEDGEVEDLRIENTFITDRGIAYLAKLPNLRRLRLTGNELSDESLVHLSHSKSLRELWLQENGFTAKGIAELAKYPELVELLLEGDGIRNDAILALQGCQRLRSLNLCQRNITSDAFVPLAKLTELEELDLSFTRVSNRRIEALKQLTKLETLHLRNTLVNLHGLERLAPLAHVKKLDFGGDIASFTREERERAQALFPQADWRVPAPLSPLVLPPAPAIVKPAKPKLPSPNEF